MDSEIGRFPRLFRGAEHDSGADLADLTFESEMSVFLGQREVKLLHLGRGPHGAATSWPGCRTPNVMFSGDLVEYHSACYCGDAHLRRLAAHARRDPRLRAEGAGAGPRRRADEAEQKVREAHRA